MLTPTTIHGTADVPRSHRGFVLSGVEGPLGPIDSFNPHLASIPKLSSRTGETRKPPMLHFSKTGPHSVDGIQGSRSTASRAGEIGPSPGDQSAIFFAGPKEPEACAT